ncbi:MAG: dihydrofolate reductase [Geobacteraceae bacterium]|nr:dihydrofolate reductase [Geobacteraceae bacterium]
MIAIIAAMSRNGVIGRGGKIPWHIPADMKRFRALTLGHTVIMGRKTFESIGRALPERKNIVVSRNASFSPEGALKASSLDDALTLAAGAEIIFICGGSEIYRQSMTIASRIYLTVVAIDEAGDAFFPEVTGFIETGRERISTSPSADLITLERAAGGGQ